MEELNLAKERKDYRGGHLNKRDLLPDPIAQFQIWLKDAFSAGIPEPNAMSLATASADGKPLVRTVLLKGVDQHGFQFFTNLRSRKAIQLSENPIAALLFFWSTLERQVVITGRTVALSSTESEEYFASRPRESQLSAWASPQSQVISSREFLEREWEVIRNQFGEGKIPLPSSWGGFRVVPDTIEFWQGGAHRLHDRLQYQRDAKSRWKINRLGP